MRLLQVKVCLLAKKPRARDVSEAVAPCGNAASRVAASRPPRHRLARILRLTKGMSLETPRIRFVHRPKARLPRRRILINPRRPEQASRPRPTKLALNRKRRHNTARSRP